MGALREDAQSCQESELCANQQSEGEGKLSWSPTLT